MEAPKPKAEPAAVLKAPASKQQTAQAEKKTESKQAEEKAEETGRRLGMNMALGLGLLGAIAAAGLVLPSTIRNLLNRCVSWLFLLAAGCACLLLAAACAEVLRVLQLLALLPALPAGRPAGPAGRAGFPRPLPTHCCPPASLPLLPSPPWPPCCRQEALMKSAVSRVASLKEKVESQAGDLKMLQASRAEAAGGGAAWRGRLWACRAQSRASCCCCCSHPLCIQPCTHTWLCCPACPPSSCAFFFGPQEKLQVAQVEYERGLAKLKSTAGELGSLGSRVNNSEKAAMGEWAGMVGRERWVGRRRAEAGWVRVHARDKVRTSEFCCWCCLAPSLAVYVSTF